MIFSDSGLPAFFDQAPSMTVRDPLAQFLGTAAQGVMQYRYADAVRLAGHSCPTVAGAWLMTLQGLRALYGQAMPVRGEIEVHMRQGEGSGVTGVIASVAQLVTGAAAETGFQGIGKQRRFSRQHLLRFGDGTLDHEMALRRKDTGEGVRMRIDTSAVPMAEEMKALLPLAVSGEADDTALQRFALLWQERVRRMLIDHSDDRALVQVQPWG